jgi:hypothetical protein
MDAKAGAHVLGPIGPYHSAIAFFAYRSGLSVEAALRLFKHQVFDALGYFDVWDAAAEQLLKNGRALSIDLSADLLRWTNRGCFMYSINHPKPRVLFDVARHLMAKADVPTAPIDFDNYVVDDLARGFIYPVYPEIAEFYGIEGSYIFKGAHFSLSIGIGNFWNLRRFVEECYGLYATRDRLELTNERVQGWLESAHTSEYLKAAAGESLAEGRDAACRHPNLALKRSVE